MEDFGLPHPNHNFLEAHPTVSSELLLRLGHGDAVAKPNVAELLGDRVRFEDGSTERVDVIVFATGYKINFPFFDEDFLSAPENRLPLSRRAFRPGVDDLALIGFAQVIPTLFPFVELQSKLAAAYVDGDYALPLSPRWRRRSAPTRPSTSAISPSAPATRCRWTGTSTSTRCGRRRCPRDASAPAADGRRSRRAGGARGARNCLSAAT